MELQPIREEHIAQFCEVTGADEGRARIMLEASHGNVQMAISLYLDSAFGPAPSAPAVPVRAPILQRTQRLSRVSRGNVRRLTRTNVFGTPPNTVFDMFKNSSNNQQQQQQLPPPLPANEEEVGIGDSNASLPESKKAALARLYGAPTQLIVAGPFAEVMERAERENKWLLVNVQKVREFVCHAINRNVWNRPEVGEMLQRRFLFWQVDSESYEGSWYVQFYGVKSWPQASIVDPTCGIKMADLPPKSLAGAEPFLAFAEEFLAAKGFPIEEEEKEEEEGKEEVGDVPMDTSDSGNGNDENAANEPKKEEEEEEDEGEFEDGASYEDYLGPSSDEVTRLLLRLPSGERTVLEWPCTTPVAALGLYVVGVCGHRKFEVVVGFPRKVVDVRGPGGRSTLVAAGLHPQQTLIVHLLQ